MLMGKTGADPQNLRTGVCAYCKISRIRISASFVAVFLLIIIASVVHNSTISTVYAADDNTQQPLCELATDYCDIPLGQAHCTGYGFQWTANGYPGGAGNPSCCGDDSQENVQTRVVNLIDGGLSNGLAIASDPSDLACCADAVSCVYNGSCYAEFQKITVGTDQGVCVKPVGGSSGEPRAWYDCDDSDGQIDFCAQCGYTQVPSGEASVGEYAAVGNYACCGDDAGEYYINTMCPGVSGGAAKCCSDPGDRIDASGNCVETCPQPDLVVTDIQFPGSLWCATEQNIWVTVKNQGNGWASNSPTVPTGEVWDTGVNQKICEWSLGNASGGIPPGSSETYNCPTLGIGGVPLTPRWTPTSPGVYALQARVDVLNNIAESYEDNNNRDENVIVDCDSDPPDISFTPASRSWSNTNVTVDVGVTDVSSVPINRYCWTTGASCTPDIGFSPATEDPTQTANGDWRLYVYAEDSLGQGATEWSGQYRIDKDYPVISDMTAEGLTYLQDPVYVNDGNASINWLASDSGGSGLSIVELWRTVDLGGNPDSSGWEWRNEDDATPASGPLSDASGDGNFWYGIHANDSAGNCVTETGKDCLSGNAVPTAEVYGPINVIFDATQPTISFNPTSRAWLPDNISVTVTASDTLSGVKSGTTLYCWTTGASCTPATAFTSGQIITQSGDGNWTLCASISDNAGNSRSSCSGPYRRDAQLPAIQSLGITNFVSGTTVNITGRPTVSWQVTDQATLSGLQYVQVYRRDGGCGDDNWVDVSGNISVSLPNPGLNNGTWTEASAVANGHYCYGLHVNDAAGNWVAESPAQRQFVTVDTKAPVVIFNPLTVDWTKTSVTVTVSANDMDTGGVGGTVDNGVDATRHCWQDGTGGTTSCDPGTGVSTFSNYSGISQTNTGTWYLCIRTSDTVGNWSQVPTVANGLCKGPYRIDNQIPTAWGSGDGSLQCESVMFRIDGTGPGIGVPSDAHSGLQLPNAYSFDNGITWESSRSKAVSVPKGGSVSRTLKVRDMVNNQWSWTSPSISTNSCDEFPPAISFNISSRPWSNTNASVTVTADDSGAQGDSNVRYLRRCTSNATTSCDPGTTAANEPTTITCDGTTPQCAHTEVFSADGSWYLCARARDNGVPGVWSVLPTSSNGLCKGPYQVDKTPPVANFSGVGGNSAPIDCENIVWSITDATDALSGLHALPYSFDDGVTWQSSNIKYETVIGGGSVTRTLKVRDIAGNIASWGPAQVSTSSCNVSPDLPSNLWQSPGVPGSVTRDNTPYMTFTIADQNAGDTIRYQIQIFNTSSPGSPVIDYTWLAGSSINPNNVTFQVPDLCPGIPDYTSCSAPLADGTYTWRVKTIDQDGAESGWASLPSGFIVDTTPPPVPTCAPVPGNYTSSQNVTLVSAGSAGIRYNLNALAPTACSSGNAYTGPIAVSLSTTINAIACDAVGNPSSPVSCPYSIGSVPNTTINTGPTDPTNQTSANFTFSGSGSPTRFDCKLDPAANQNTSYSQCDPGNPTATFKNYIGLNPGHRIFYVKSINAFGESEVADYPWLIDVTPPQFSSMTVLGYPVASSPILTALTSVPVAWSIVNGGDAGIKEVEVWRYEDTCAQADSDGWAGPKLNKQIVSIDPTYPGPVSHSGSVVQTLPESTYCFGLHVNDHAGNWADEGAYGPIQVTIEVNQAPNLPSNLTQSPGEEGARTNNNRPSFDFEISDPNVSETIGYRIQIDDTANFSSPVIDYTWAGLASNPNNVTFQIPSVCPGSGYAACTSPLPDGSYYWRVKAIDDDGAESLWGTDATTGSEIASDNGFFGPGVDFILDTLPPPKPTCAPGVLGGDYAFSSTVSVSCSDTEAGVVIWYSLDGGDAAQYAGNFSFSNTVALEVWAEDASGNVSASPNNIYTYTRCFVPSTVIDATPADPSGDTNPAFEFSGTNSPTQFECKLDSLANQNTDWALCTSPKNYSALNQGMRTFSVRASSSCGTDTTPESYTWLIDPEDPAVNDLAVEGNRVGSSPFTTNDTDISVSWDVSDTGGSGLRLVEVFRFDDVVAPFDNACDDAAAAGWAGAVIDPAQEWLPPYPGPGSHIGEATYTLPNGTYCFGLHVTDHVGRWVDEGIHGPIQVTVDTSAVPSFTINIDPNSHVIEPGQSAESQVVITAFNGLSERVDLSGSSSPAGLGVSFSPSWCVPSPGSPCTVTLTITSQGSDPEGNYIVNVDGVSASASASDEADVLLSTTNEPPQNPQLCGPNELSNCN